MSCVLQCNGQIVGQVFPEVKLVNNREEIHHTCIFVNADQADGAIRLIRGIKEFACEVFIPESYDKVPSKYDNIKTHAVRPNKMNLLQNSTKPMMCDCCSVTIPIATYLRISNGSSKVTMDICPFCAAKIGDTAADLIKEIPESVQNEYHTYRVEQGFAWLSGPADDKLNDLISDLPF